MKKEVEFVVKSFPHEEKFSLSDQLLRSVRSVEDQLHFCIQAREPVGETLNHMIDAFDTEYISKERLVHFKSQVDTVGKLLNGYVSYLRKNL